MLFPILGGLAAVSAFTAAQAPSLSSYTDAEILSGAAFQNISDIASETMQSNIGSNPACTYDNADVRKEWRTLPKATRKEFTDAVICLQKMKPQSMTADEAADYPGVHSRFDEYVATHINYTYNIHDTADFFAWHRAFTHFMEQDLKTLCGCKFVHKYASATLTPV